MKALASELRRQLGKTVLQAREAAEVGARKALEALAVHEPEPYKHLSEAQRLLRRALRAQARQLGDEETRTKKGAYEITHLKEKVAYDQWHRLLFARFLIENNLLISPEHGVAVSFHDCEELAPALGFRDGWAVAAKFAAAELPEIFRVDDPTGRIDLPVEDLNPLIQLVTRLPAEVFVADDSLGWVYQFWQAKRKDEVNESGTKIGADELAPVTQLFTEDYMVLFLLHNTLGAWWAGKMALADPSRFKVETEQEARIAAALPGIEWTYLRFTKTDTGEWCPAAGTFDGWPKGAKEVRVLDPCMGSGHFLVAELPILVALRIAEEKLAVEEAVIAVLRDNLYGLELDFRCTQIAAFNLAMAAWKLAGYQKLPSLNLACSGLAPRTKLEIWTKLANGNERLREGMEQLYRLFKDGPTLGSLINPRKFGGNLLIAGFHELQPLLQNALEREDQRGDETGHELTVTARGLAQAGEILAKHYTLVATNVPYLGRGNQDDVLKDYCQRVHPEAKADLATCFIERCLDFCVGRSGSTALVTAQNFLFLGSYKHLRHRLLRDVTWETVTRLGPHAFETIGGEVVNVVLLILSQCVPSTAHLLAGFDASAQPTPSEKAMTIATAPVVYVNQANQLANPEGRIIIDRMPDLPLLNRYLHPYAGINCGDSPRFLLKFWELQKIEKGWLLQQTAGLGRNIIDGLDMAFLWEEGKGQFFAFVEALDGRLGGSWRRGEEAWGRQGVAVSRMSGLHTHLYLGSLFDQSVSVLMPQNKAHLLPVLCYCLHGDFKDNVRKHNPALAVSTAVLADVPFDLVHWQEVAAEKYPDGLPNPHCDNPSQWIFNGHPNTTVS